MRICVIADLHGSDRWRQIISQEGEQVDRFLFLGDYFDDHREEISATAQFDNFCEIVELCAERGDIDLLVGNHDLQYCGGARCDDYSGALFAMAHDYLTEQIRTGVLQAVALYGRYLFSHAGVSTEWMRVRGLFTPEAINRQFVVAPLALDFVDRPGAAFDGNNTYQSPVWIRPEALYKALPPQWHQVVGHTQIAEITQFPKENRKLIFTDTDGLQYVIIDTASETEQIKPLY